MSKSSKPERHFAPLFTTGQVVATPGAMRALEHAGVEAMDLLARHVFGDFGDLCEEDRETNNQAVAHGGRIFSSYSVGAGPTEATVWVITEADRSSTCALLPKEY